MQIRCDGMSRRDFVRISSLTALGYGAVSGADTAGEFTGGVPTRARACILVWLDGGPTHLETFDPKPDAPAEVRGPLGCIPTRLPGIAFNEYLPQLADMADRLTVIRSVTSPLGEHNFGTHFLMTGYRPSPALEYPTYGAALAHLREPSTVLPPYIAVPRLRNVSGNGFLPDSTAPFATGGNPDSPDFKVRDLDIPPTLSLSRLDRRRRMTNALNRFYRAADADKAIEDPDLERAYRLLASADTTSAFDLTQESAEVRNRYGRGGGSGIGQGCLLARRLVERGVPFVTVNSGGWDTHQDIAALKSRFPNDRNAHLPSLDKAVSALINDLQDRGLLEETLVMVMGEFGRTPKINTAGGRDHWPNCFSVMMAGGGVPRGRIIGSSDALAEQPADRPVTPSDLAASVYTLLGINPATMLRTRDGRPVRVTPDGSEPLPELLG